MTSLWCTEQAHRAGLPGAQHRAVACRSGGQAFPPGYTSSERGTSHTACQKLYQPAERPDSGCPGANCKPDVRHVSALTMVSAEADNAHGHANVPVPVNLTHDNQASKVKIMDKAST
jgi:hypothetical protein